MAKCPNEKCLQIENGLDTPTQLPGVLSADFSHSTWRMTRIEISEEKTICHRKQPTAAAHHRRRRLNEFEFVECSVYWNEMTLQQQQHHQLDGFITSLRGRHRCLLGAACRRQMTAPLLRQVAVIDAAQTITRHKDTNCSKVVIFFLLLYPKPTANVFGVMVCAVLFPPSSFSSPPLLPNHTI